MKKIVSIIKKYWLLALCAVILIVPAAAYISVFHSSPLSSNPDDWGNFGSFFGGVYSILVTVLVVYLARELSKKDERIRKKQDALEIIYKQIDKINPEHIDIRSVHRIFRLVESNKLYISETVANLLVDFANYFIEVKNQTRHRDTKYEEKIKSMIIDAYNG